MAEQESVAADVTAEVSDQQVDKYFETKGETLEEKAPEPEVEKEKAKEPEIEKEEDGEETPSKENDKIADNYKAMAHKERKERQEIQKALQEQQMRTQRMEQTFQKMVEQAQLQQQQAQQQQEPSFEDDPLNALRLGQERLAQQQNWQLQQDQQKQQQAQYEKSRQQFLNEYADSAIEYAKDKTDFNDAYRFLVQSRLVEYKEAGYDKQQAEKLLIEDELAIAAKAYQDGVNPAERIYNVATARGYKLAAPQSNIDETKQRLDQLEKGIKSSKSLSNVGGKREVPLTLEAVAAMDDEEFANIDWNKLMKLG